MIRVLCLNPVIDRMYYINNFTAGSKFFEIKPHVYIGGKGINIARVMSIMGEPCELYGFIGGHSGEEVRQEMKQYGVPFKAIELKGDTRTTINIIDKFNQWETEITEPGTAVSRKEQQRFMQNLAQDLLPGDMVICSGIPMKGMDENIYQQISKLCESRQCDCVLDATGVYLKSSLPGKYFFTKPNVNELSELFSITEFSSEEDIVNYGKRLLDMGIDHLLISTGEEGGIFLNRNVIFKTIIPKTKVVSTIGSGDSAVAGFCLGVRRGMRLEDCVRLAMACGINNAGFSKVGYVERAAVETLYERIELSYI